MRTLLAFLLCFCCLFSCAHAERIADLEPLSEALAATALPDGVARPSVLAALEGWCRQADQALAQAGLTLNVRCETENEADDWTLLRFVADGYRLATIRFDTTDGEVRLPPEDTLRALGDARFVCAALAMHAVGLEVPPDWHGQRATDALALGWLVRAYEARAGEVSLAGAVVAQDAPVFLRKSVIIGLLSPSELAELDAPQSALTRLDWAEYLLRWAAIVEREVCRRAATPATLGEGLATLQLTTELAGFRLDAGKSRTNVKNKQTPLTRSLYARTAIAWLKKADRREGAKATRWLPTLDDCEGASEREACGLGLMRYVSLEPDGFACFDPTRVMSLEEVWEHAQRFAMSALSVQNEAAARPLTVGEALPDLQRLLDEADSLARYDGPVTRVDNGIDAPWYFAQDDSGPYSEANCMPAAAAMVLRWLDPLSDASPESLRNDHLLDGAPWYPEQVMAVFREHGVVYTTPEIDRDSMVKALDAGHILLALLNETGSGHSVVIKGYTREGEGLWFTVYDPASPSTDAFGQPIGRDRRIEATQLYAAMECHWWLYFDIPRAQVVAD